MKIISTTIAALVLAVSGNAIADSKNESSAVDYRWEVDMRGKPPYKRVRVPVETIDIAAMEVIDGDLDGNIETEVVWQREFTGRPPFNRERVELPVVDAASMELVDDEPRITTFRGRPPFNRHR